MPQEIRVVKCYNCQIYQTDIVKKAKKWQCKLCGEKQSVLAEFYKGTGQECRLRAQKLNEKRQIIDEVEMELSKVVMSKYEDTCDINDSQEISSNVPQNTIPANIIKNNVKHENKWLKFIEKKPDDEKNNEGEVCNFDFVKIESHSSFDNYDDSEKARNKRHSNSLAGKPCKFSKYDKESCKIVTDLFLHEDSDDEQSTVQKDLVLKQKNQCSVENNHKTSKPVTWKTSKWAQFLPDEDEN